MGKEKKQIRIKAEAAGASERSLELRPSSRASRRPAGYTHAHASPPANRVGFCCARALGLTASRDHRELSLSLPCMILAWERNLQNPWEELYTYKAETGSNRKPQTVQGMQQPQASPTQAAQP
ncbi:hypothetical protein Q7C36_000696 [Tachysurus vachellii]|uniref:Uncharacterized protein n=1 Tax=Tachysurus vachellii TaxID=175792 RepID=A0AA88P2H8_TACVA|nr:hypothetical protein Q7C36_000696 [Tachysurus vachellii]